jgi:alpha-glucuronidase
MIEFQITQEYLGQGNHLVFLAPLFRECLTAETGRGTVAQVTGADAHSGLTAIAGVANIGLDANWCGHDFAQANWYAFGRLAWRPTLASEQIADEWLLQTFTALTSEHRQALSEMMLQSREAVVDYMMPLGLHHLFANGHHYGPEPWFHDSTMRRDWQPPYYHQADSVGIGFDRTVATGSGATAQYASEIGARFESVEQCPESLLLWFHHLNWDYRLSDGATLWQNLCRCYQRGVNTVRRFQVVWDEIQPDIDSERFEAIRHKLILQAHDAEWWRDACLQYFQSLNGRSLPPDVERPVTSLEELRQIHLPMTHHN